ncbi:hypothetical protein PGTUg99_009573 [Puccinia graminis f. sp. tritici]|uniref:CxC1-like cysteine cluster associated with KDZ transposases domain-containing protein n=1 Tax=Puccinia graminis f. sp. tritici TaxID=56615 RepID=A0A5B0SA47_PUCGR|nr:hypothetical protein PGTUg99_009573 [Puccinia graminis f. sp. tritici]
MSHNLYKFHYGCQLPSTESRSQKTIRLAFEKQTAAEIGQRLKRTINRNRQNPQNNTSQSGAANHHNIQADNFNNEHNELGFNKTSLWEDYEHVLNDEDKALRARMGLLHQELLQQQKDGNWKDILDALFLTYLHMKKLTANWTLPSAFDNFSALVCSCSPDKYKSREIDLVDLMDPVHLLANGYLASTPVFPQTAFSLCLLNFYDLLWNICNAHRTPFAKVLQRWNETMSPRLCVKNQSKLQSMQQNLIQTVTLATRQDVLAQRSCPACFGVSLPSNDPMAAPDDSKVFVCLDGNFQHRHHLQASKNYIEVERQPLFVQPQDLEVCNTEIREAELAKRVSQKAVRSIFISLVFHV